MFGAFGAQNQFCFLCLRTSLIVERNVEIEVAVDVRRSTGDVWKGGIDAPPSGVTTLSAARTVVTAGARSFQWGQGTSSFRGVDHRPNRASSIKTARG